jgi:aminopeptidase
MARRLSVISCALMAGLFLWSCQREPSTDTRATPRSDTPTPAARSEAPPTDLDQLAERIVRQSAGVQRGEHVVISGHAHDLELLENLAVHVRRLGAFPVVTLSSDRMAKRMFFDVPAELDAQVDTFWLKTAEHVNAVISVSNSLEEGTFADADPKRIAARANAGQQVLETMFKRGVRQVEVGNGLYPTERRAERFGMSQDDLAKTFWEGVNIDYSSLAARADEVRNVLASGSDIHITDASGTDLRMRIQGRPIHASDGIISPEEAKKGGAAASVFLPAGEVYVAPVPGTAEGRVVRPRDYYQGMEIRDLTMTFAGGRLTSLTGSGPGFERMKAVYDAAAEGKDVFGALDFGINPNVKLSADSQVGTWVPAGTVTVGFGNNMWAGGDNKVPYGHYVSLPRASVTLDGKTIVENGALKM